MDIKYLFVRERVRNKEVYMVNISTHKMIAYPLTKGLSPKLFKEHVTSMGAIESFDILG